MNYLEQLGIGGTIIRDLIFVGGELILLFLVYKFVSAIIRFALNRVINAPSLESFTGKVIAIRKVVLLSLILLFIAFSVAILGVNGFQIYKGNDLQQYTFDLLHQIPTDFWTNLALSMAKVVGLVVVARTLTDYFSQRLERFRKRAIGYKQLRSNNESVNQFFARLDQILSVAIWLMVLYITARLFPFPEVVAHYTMICFKIYIIISVGLLIVNAIAAIVDSLDGLSKHYAESNDLFAFYQRLRHLIPLLRRSLEYIVYVAGATLALTQLAFIAHLAKFGPGIIQGIGVIFIARVVVEVINLLVDRSYLNDQIPEEERQRNETIYPILKNMLAGVIYFIALVLVMRGLGFDPIPLLVGAGILGMVVGLGAQSLINDVVSGFFIIFENSFRIGDFIEVRQASGRVESIALRTTRVRSPDGQQYILRNGNLGDIVNYSRQYTNAVVEIGVEHTSDLDQVYSVLGEIGKTLFADCSDVVEATVVEGLNDISGPEVVIRTKTKVKPGCHTSVARELRRRIKEGFEKEGIGMPFEKRYNLM